MPKGSFEMSIFWARHLARHENKIKIIRYWVKSNSPVGYVPC